MSIEFILPASIECEVIKLKWRKLVSYPPEMNHKFNMLLYKYTCERNCEAYIESELNPKIAQLDVNSMLNQGDGIKGEQMRVLTIKAIKLSNISLSKGSATHKAQFCVHRGYTFAKLTRAFSNIPIS